MEPSTKPWGKPLGAVLARLGILALGIVSLAFLGRQTARSHAIDGVVGYFHSSGLSNGPRLRDSSRAPDPRVHALLVAGSRGWGNYRHQADVAHAYWILEANSIPRESIILMFYDDIANNTMNPHPGTIRNNPEGENLYAKLPKDYTGEEVNARNFLGVLRGDTTMVTKNSQASGRVLSASGDDRIFVYYSDHGAPGLLGMPTGDYLYADQLMAAIRHRYAHRGYKEMVLFIEACESGSMFDGLLVEDELLNVYAMTASNPRESSWAAYCPGMSPGPPGEYNTCLGDLYSVSWMEDVEQKNLKRESLKALFDRVKNRTRMSHVMEYGELEIDYEPVSWYLGNTQKMKKEGTHMADALLGGSSASGPPREGMVLEQRDADLASLVDPTEREKEIQRRQELDLNVRETVFRALVSTSLERGSTLTLNFAAADLGLSRVPTAEWNWECLRSMITTYEASCGRLSDYGMKHSWLFATLCRHAVDPEKSLAGAISC
jgi:legumain